MKVRLLVASVVALGLAARMVTVYAQPGRHHDGTVHVPDSSRDRDEDHGQRAHTNHVVHLRGAAPTTPSGESPQSLIPYYVPGYPATIGGANPNQGSGIIAIVDAFHYPTALADFNTFAQQFGLPVETSKNATAATNKVFQVVYTGKKQPAGDCGWNQEEALDIEWAHAVAPKAKIVLIEAASSSFNDLLKAVDLANSLAASANGNIQVSMSWGGSEFSGEGGFDSHFNNPTVAYLAASGDTGGKTIYPGTSPFVVAAGGTSLTFSGGVISGETGWSGSGGGTSPYVGHLSPEQDGILTGKNRSTPDISFDADPATGVSVYDSTKCGGLTGWMVFGGTSVASPALAGIVNLNTASGGALGQGVLPALYDNFKSSASTFFHDVTTGKAGTFLAGSGWDFVTGIGSSKTLGWH
jgi:kumamolisin